MLSTAACKNNYHYWKWYNTLNEDIYIGLTISTVSIPLLHCWLNKNDLIAQWGTRERHFVENKLTYDKGFQKQWTKTELFAIPLTVDIFGTWICWHQKSHHISYITLSLVTALTDLPPITQCCWPAKRMKTRTTCQQNIEHFLLSIIIFFFKCILCEHPWHESQRLKALARRTPRGTETLWPYLHPWLSVV